MKLNVLALGLASGVVWGIGIFLAGMFAMGGWGVTMVDALASFYLGYGPSVVGAAIGAIWAFFDGFVAGAVIAWLYNRFARV